MIRRDNSDSVADLKESLQAECGVPAVPVEFDGEGGFRVCQTEDEALAEVLEAVRSYFECSRKLNGLIRPLADSLVRIAAKHGIRRDLHARLAKIDGEHDDKYELGILQKIVRIGARPRHPTVLLILQELERYRGGV